jgi:WD repeat-containing protein 68
MEAGADGQDGRILYQTPWPSYALAWSSSVREASRFRLAVGSCLQDETNKIQVVEMAEESKTLEVVAEVEHPYPATKLMWRESDGREAEQARGRGLDLLASTSTTLNIWKLEDGQITLKTELANKRKEQGKSGQLPPLTSFDWSGPNPHKVGASSVDTTCTIWNIEAQKVETQLIAHDKAVYDIAFSQADSLFASVGADGSVRLFDQRNLDHSTIIYEAAPPSPLLRLAWNKLNTNHIATISMDTPGVILIDMRRPSVPLASLSPANDACVNHIAWAPHSRHHLLCGTEDGCALIWDVKDVPAKPESASGGSNERATRVAPVLSYECDHEVYQVQWPASQPEYVALGMSRQIEVQAINLDEK